MSSQSLFNIFRDTEEVSDGLVETSRITLDPSSSRVTIASSSEVTSPSPSQVTIASSSEVTSPSPSQVTIASSSEVTIPSSSQVTIASSSEVTIPSSSQVTIASSSEVTIPSSSQVTIAPLKDVGSTSQGKKNTKHQAKKGKSMSLTASEWAIKGQSNSVRIRKLRSVVDKAIADHKIFTVVGVYPALRGALKRRGWLEKRGVLRPKKPKKRPAGSTSSLQSPTGSYVHVPGRGSVSEPSKFAEVEEDTDDMLVARLLRDAPPADFLWTMKDSIEWSNLSKHQIVNRFQRAYFNTKVGLCSYMQQMHWYCEVGVSDIHFPRCYTIGLRDELAAFKYDFRITACLNLLKWLVSSYEAGGVEAVQSVEGRVPVSVVDFAVERSNDYISKQLHEDIDREDYALLTDHQWHQFLSCYYMIVHNHHLLREDDAIEKTYTVAKDTLRNIKTYWPQLDIDGMLNIWIVKPGNKSRGRGIKLMSNLKDILARANPNMPKESRYVVQKYIERPLLIHNTKFDIRQWFLVTCADPLTIWMYKECYLRFCSQSFNLQDMHEAVHLCNNAVQKKYKNGKRDSPDLPEDNMWDSHKFKNYLSTIGQDDVWDKRIYPGMKEGIIGTLLASQEHMGTCPNCFELFGADFMITEDFSTWLIEINSCPDLSSSTSVTARLCPQCLEDVIKVVVDRRCNKTANTGMFEMVFKQQVPRVLPYLGISLAVRGKGIVTDKKDKKLSRRMSTISDGRSISSHTQTKHRIKQYAGPIIDNLIDGLARNLDQAVADFEESAEPTQAEANAKLCTQKIAVIKKKHRKGPKRALKKTKKTKPPATLQQSVINTLTEKYVQETEKSQDDTTLCSKCQFQGRNPVPPSLMNVETAGKKRHENEVAKPLGKEIPLNIGDLLEKPKTRQTTTKKMTPSEEINAYREALSHLNQTKASCENFLDKLKILTQNNKAMATPKYFSVNKNTKSESPTSNKPAICKIVEKLALSQPKREFFVSTNGQGFIRAFSGISLSGSQDPEEK